MSLENQRQERKQRCIQCRKREPKAKTTHAQSLSVSPVAHRHTSLKDVFFHASLLKDLPSVSGTKQGLEPGYLNPRPQSLTLQQTEKSCLLKPLPRLRNHLGYLWALPNIWRKLNREVSGNEEGGKERENGGGGGAGNGCFFSKNSFP